MYPLIAVFVFPLVSGMTPMICQRSHGMTRYKIERPSCALTETLYEWTANTYTPERHRKSRQGRLVSLYRYTCVSHWFLLGGFTHNDWVEKVPFGSSNLRLLKDGACPSESHPFPLVVAPKTECEWRYGRKTTTIIEYCLKSEASVKENDKGYAETGGEDIDTTMDKGQGVTDSGSYISWDPVPLSSGWTKTTGDKYMCSESICYPVGKQKGYGLREEIKYGNVSTEEGVMIEFTSRRSRRSNDLRTALEDLRGDILGKLQYSNHVIKNTLEKRPHLWQGFF
ncbi:hypothetical protein QAD02_009499 [Eretmocerus hayati]|uniref:Uncharacterized protein n=1 Tax=Eretmocerus hayati TaxID=131215 RepID=A0ACC2N9U5_9HYME|nr:hypothetical protein QAD02_009499 [Eretmocerus hayati]